MQVAVFGLRDYKGKEYDNYEHVSESLEIFEKASLIITGGGKGIEMLALRYATDNGIEPQVIPPNIQKFGHAAAFQKRNIEILRVADIAAIFWDGEDKFYVELMKTCLSMNKRFYGLPIV